MPRGRPRKKANPFPPCFYESHGAYYHVVKNVWHPLGSVLPTALEAYGRRVAPGAKEGQLNPLIDAAFERMKSNRAKPLAKNTIRIYERAAKNLKHIARQFTRPDQVKQKDAAQLKLLLASKPAVANQTLVFARLVFADFVEQQVCDSNPFVGIRRHKTRARKKLLSAAEWEAVYTKASPRLQCMMDGMRLTDQRVLDVVNLDERNILDDGAGIYFKQQKTGNELIVKWNTELREWVARCRSMHKKVVAVDFKAVDRVRPLFRSRRGKPPAYMTVYAQWREATKAAGVDDCDMRDIRAYAATSAKKQGLDPQKLLGHTNAGTTIIYLRDREVPVVDGPQFKRILGSN